ncbi:MAG: hydroxyethylthiazole kinase-like uncharacterized protein yjeF [Neolewinella sp.]|jgi:hydroxyethylthiazole kinase-like uncharacterized protein yjeF
MRRLETKDKPVFIVCGTGNNGGDGLVVARLLHEKGHQVSVSQAMIGSPNEDNRTNHKRAEATGVRIQSIEKNASFPTPPINAVIIDALFGTGLSRPLEGYWASLIKHLNHTDNTRYALDLPSGLFADSTSNGVVFRADHTLTLGYPKLALFSQINTQYVGTWENVAFDLAVDFVEQALSTPNTVNLPTAMKALLKSRRPNDHKGTFGHALLIAGSYGKIGAAIIAGRSVLRAGAGLLTYHVPHCGYEILQIALPEAMVITDEHVEHVRKIGSLSAYQAVGIGPGIGQAATTAIALHDVLERFDQPMVIDADALNILGRTRLGLNTSPTAAS